MFKSKAAEEHFLTNQICIQKSLYCNFCVYIINLLFFDYLNIHCAMVCSLISRNKYYQDSSYI